MKWYLWEVYSVEMLDTRWMRKGEAKRGYYRRRMIEKSDFDCCGDLFDVDEMSFLLLFVGYAESA